MQLQKEHFTLNENDLLDPASKLRRLYLIFKETLYPEMSWAAFAVFYMKSKPHCIQITFLRDKGQDVGFFTCAYSHMQLLGKKTVICRVAIGIIKEYHGGAMPFGALCLRIIKYKLRHPFAPVFMVAYLANPLVYATIAKYTAEYWPSRNKATPSFIGELKDAILIESQMKHIEVRSFVLKIHFPVQISQKLEDRINNSSNPDVKFYLKRNPDFTKQMGLMTIVPVRWLNIIANIRKALLFRPLKKASAGIARLFMLS